MTSRTWVKRESSWQRRGHTPILIGDDFVVGVTRPQFFGTGDVRNNVGCLPGVPRTTVASVTQSAGAVHQNLTITGKVSISAPNQTFRNCRFTFSSSGDSTGGLVQSHNSQDHPTALERCEFEPSKPWDRYNALYGHHLTVYRCAITKVVDGLGLYNPSGGPIDSQILGNWIGWLSWYADDRYVDPDGNSFPSGRQWGHSDGSHSDGVQAGGSGGGIVVRGNFWQMAKYNGLNPDNCTLNEDESFTIAPGNGITPLNHDSGARPQSGQCFLGNADAYGPFTGLTFENNWIWNGNHGVLLQRGPAQGSSPIVATVRNNIFGGRWRAYGSGLRYYPIRYGFDTIINGFQPTADGQHADTDGNVWDAGCDPSMTISGVHVGGQPVLHRYDSVQ